jgi:hypothetical protein
MEIAERSQASDKRGLRKIAANLMDLAESGEFQAMREVADRTDGRPAQQIVMQGDDDGGPIRLFAEIPMKSSSTEQWLEDIGVKVIEGTAVEVASKEQD